MKVYKAVIQVPHDDELADAALALRWQESENPHGPHIKVYPDRSDPETDEPCIQIRCKHRGLDELRGLVDRVLEALDA